MIAAGYLVSGMALKLFRACSRKAARRCRQALCCNVTAYHNADRHAFLIVRFFPDEAGVEEQQSEQSQ